MCGLKQVVKAVQGCRGCVTPFVGVWIETHMTQQYQRHSYVTPFVGVWIETNHYQVYRTDKLVTPFVGVWIETLGNTEEVSLTESHPSWVCGLKLCPGAGED